ncbi:MAG TPA: DedA family protein [Streptosporangiaceae bacterium]|jgi:membrane protein DedA with SNARE-associated domain
MTSFLTDSGYWALIIFAFVQACCIPISSEITFGFAGVLAFEGHLSLPLVIIIGAVAEIAGSSTAYGLGRLGGRHTVDRYRKYLLMTRKDVERAEAFFDGRGAWSVAIARVIPLVRAFAGLAAGFMEVPALAFEAFNAIGTLVWAAALSLIGYELGSSWDKASKNVSHASDALAAIAVLLIVGLIVHKALEMRKERAADAASAIHSSEAAPGEGEPKQPAATGAQSQPGQVGASPQPEAPERPHSHRRRPD